MVNRGHTSRVQIKEVGEIVASACSGSAPSFGRRYISSAHYPRARIIDVVSEIHATRARRSGER